MYKFIISLALALVPFASDAQPAGYLPFVSVQTNERLIADYDLTLYLKRGKKLIPDFMQPYIREDAITYYPWLYGPSYLMSSDETGSAATYCFGRDGDKYYLVLELKDPGHFPYADIQTSPFLNVLNSDSSVLTLPLDTVTLLIESLWYFINSEQGVPRGLAVIEDETTDPYMESNTSSSYTLAQYRLDIVFRIDDIDAFMRLRPLKFDFLGGQYVYDFTDKPKFIKRFVKGICQSRKRLEKAYDRYQKDARAVFK